MSNPAPAPGPLPAGPENRTYPLTEGVPDALVIHCADPRFQDAFRRFLAEELGVRMPAVIAISGAVGYFGVSTALPKHWYSMKGHIGNMVERHSFSRVILINHDDCRGYAKVANLLGGIAKVPEMQRRHLTALAEYLRKEFLPAASFELYQARIVPAAAGRAVRFEKVV